MRFAVRVARLSALLALVVPATQVPAQASKPARRQPVTPELARTAFGDETARTLLERARAARVAQDSAITAYDAKSYLRISARMGVRAGGPQKMIFRTEHAARVRWARGGAALVEPTGRRSAFTLGAASVDLAGVVPIPYFPGREALWIPSGDMRVVQAEVNEDDMLHPLATGAEAYYRYETGDSLSFRLPDGRTIGLRELRIAARRPQWRAFVGSFWFDTESGNLVRAAYRTAAELDIWSVVSEEEKREIRELEATARTDTGVIGTAARREAERQRKENGLGVQIGRAMMSPARATLSGITVEYGLHQGRFWLPKRNVAEGELQAGFFRLPLKFEEAFEYAAVNGTDPIPLVAVAPDDTVYAGGGSINIGGSLRDSSSTARVDSALTRFAKAADSLRTLALADRAKGDTSAARQREESAAWYVSRSARIRRRREECRADSTYYAGTSSRFGGAVRTQVRMPCREATLAQSPDLPGEIFDANEEVFGSEERDALLDALDFALQPGWGPQPPVFHTGLDLLRYNRVEGFSPGVSLTSDLGLGFSARLVARIGTGDWVPNADLSLARSNGRSELRVGAFHRLGIANDDWGAPLSFGASVSNLLYARDEGFYYRTWGAELGGSGVAPSLLGGEPMRWRLFAERHRSAGAEPNTQASLGNAIGGAAFSRNIVATRLTAAGVGVELRRGFGLDPRATRLDGRFRGEGAFTDRADSVGSAGYGRVSADLAMTRAFGAVGLSVTGAAGSSVGDLPIQRAFYVGGLHTVRGQFARADGAGRVGDAFWLGRAELGLGVALRPSVFYDVGWAGPRADFGSASRPLSGAGVGLSLLDGLARFDVSRGIAPDRRWRVDASLGARF